MKKFNKKGFTIVELVIVIAVIAILAAVMIPVISGVLGNAKDSSAVSDAKTAYQEYITNNADSGEALADDFIYIYDTARVVVIKDGKIGDVYASEAAALEQFKSGAVTYVKDAAVSGNLYSIKEAPAAP